LHLAGLVDVRHGAGAGWSLARAPEEIMLRDVYNAVGQAPLFRMHRSEPNLACPVVRGIRPALGHIYAEIAQTMLCELERTSIADVLRLTLQVR
jgi:DNA-binding IscR family transcriptional regulator